MSTPVSQEAARILLDVGAVLVNVREPFTLTSGRRSPVYVDIRRLISFVAARRRIMDLAVEVLAAEGVPGGFDMVAGGETAGIPYAAFLAERLSLPMLYVRKQPKGFGRNAQIEGDLDQGRTVLLVEDLATDGGSKVKFVEVLRAAGLDCRHVFVVFHYGIFPKSQETMDALGVRLHALATWADILAVAEGDGRWDAATLGTVRQFLADPEGWTPQGA